MAFLPLFSQDFPSKLNLQPGSNQLLEWHRRHLCGIRWAPSGTFIESGKARGLQGQGIWRIVSARKTSNQPTAKQDSQKQRFDMETATRFKGGCQGEPSNLGGQWEQSNKLGLGIACKTSLCQLVPSFNTNLQDANCTCTRSVNKEYSGIFWKAGHTSLHTLPLMLLVSTISRSSGVKQP